MIIIGVRLFGKIRRSKQGLFIATRFFHICFVPIGPMESFIVTERGFWKFKGIEIETNFLSVCMAYLRTFLIPVILISLYYSMKFKEAVLDEGILRSDDAPPFVLTSLLFLISTGMLIWSYFNPRIRYASEGLSDSMERQAGIYEAPNP